MIKSFKSLNLYNNSHTYTHSHTRQFLINSQFYVEKYKQGLRNEINLNMNCNYAQS